MFRNFSNFQFTENRAKKKSIFPRFSNFLIFDYCRTSQKNAFEKLEKSQKTVLKEDEQGKKLDEIRKNPF